MAVQGELNDLHKMYDDKYRIKVDILLENGSVFEGEIIDINLYSNTVLIHCFVRSDLYGWYHAHNAGINGHMMGVGGTKWPKYKIANAAAVNARAAIDANAAAMNAAEK